MASLQLTLVLSSLMVYYTLAQAPCDPVARPCVNGMCELQANQIMGCTCNPGFIPDLTNPLVCSPSSPIIPNPNNPNNPNPVLGTCSPQPTTPQQQCMNGVCQVQGPGLSRCVCLPGFQPSINPNVCEGFDQCQMSVPGCLPGACVTSPRGAYCTACMPGFVLSQYNRCISSYQNQQNFHPWLWAWLLE